VTDANFLEEKAWERLDGVDTLVINALRRAPHPSHFTLDEALEVVERVQPRQAFLIHLSHQMGRHAELSAELPAGVACAYDGLRVTVEGPGRPLERSETVRDWDAAPDAP
jgi:phosphoribosyl 1,2-cyclic phosphate phosphodiesterase